MTPCEELGYEVGDWFTTTKTEYSKENILVLVIDDGTGFPFFDLIVGKKGDRVSSPSNGRVIERAWFVCHGTNGHLKKIEPPTEEEADYMKWFKEKVQQGKDPFAESYPNFIPTETSRTVKVGTSDSGFEEFEVREVHL